MPDTNFLILTTENNFTAERLCQEARNLGYEAKFVYYLALMHQGKTVPKLKVNKGTILIWQLPFLPNDITQNYHSICQIILENYQFKKVFNVELAKKSFLSYEDKLYETYLFDELSLPYSPLVNPDEPEFPLIARHRFGARGRSNFIINDQNELTHFVKTHNLGYYLLQKYLPLVADYRLLMLQHQSLAIAERSVTIKQDSRIGVRVKRKAKLPQQVISQAAKLTKRLGCEFSGIDVGKTQAGQYIFIEHNSRPQIAATEKTLKRNLAKEVIKSLL